MVYILIFFLLTWENFYIFWANVVANISSAALWRKAIFNFTDRYGLMLYNLFFDQGIWLIICRDLIMGWAACSRIVKFLLDPMIFFDFAHAELIPAEKLLHVFVPQIYISLCLLYCTPSADQGIHYLFIQRHLLGYIPTEEMSPSPCIPVYIKNIIESISK